MADNQLEKKANYSMNQQAAKRGKWKYADRIENRLKELGISATEASARAGLANTTVFDIVRGRNKNPSWFTISRIAQALEWSESELLGLVPSTMSVIGTADCGVYRAANGHDFDSLLKEVATHKTVTAQLSQRFPSARHFAVDLANGGKRTAFGCCVAHKDINQPVMDNKVYFVEHRVTAGAACELREWSIRRAKVTGGTAALMADSVLGGDTMPPLSVPTNGKGSGDVRVLGLVYAINLLD